MKLIKFNNGGLTLIEVVISISLLSIVILVFLTGLSNNFINISKGRDITVETFQLQEKLETEIAKFTKDELNSSSPKIKVFGKDVQYKKLDVKLENKNRNLVMYISEPNLGILPTPEIKNFFLRAYGKNNKEIFPWYEESTRLFVSYDATDPNIFQKNYVWYRSKESGGKPLKNPKFSLDYDILKSGNGIYKGTMPVSAKQVEYKELTNKRYYHFAILPYSEYGRIGKMAFNTERLLVIERTTNLYWNSLIEDSYLGKVITNLNPLVLTMNNVEELTLNVESDSSNKDNGALLYYPLENYKTNSSSFRTTVESQFEEKAVGKDAGIGVFLGDYNNGQEDGLIFLVNQKSNSVEVKKVEGGIVSTYSIKTFIIPEDFDWSKRYRWNFEILRGGEKNLKVAYKSIDDEKLIELISASQSISDLNFPTNHIGLKTWSDYNIKDSSNEEHDYVYNLTAHFYDIKIDEISRIPNNNFVDGNMFYQGNGNSSNIRNGETESQNRISLNREDMKVTGQGNDNSSTIIAKAFNISENINIQNANLSVIIEEYIIFKKNLIIGNHKDARLIIRATNDNYPVYAYLKKDVFDKLKISSNINDYTIENFVEDNIEWVEIIIKNEITILNK